MISSPLHARSVEKRSRQPKFKKPPTFPCTQCTYIAKLKHHLQAHEKTHSKEKKEKQKFACTICDYETDHFGHWQRHLDSPTHKNASDVGMVTGPLQCPEDTCNFSAQRMTKLDEHLNSVHKKNIQKEKTTYPTMDEFTDWKNALQANDALKYSKSSSTKRNKTTYYCHRSGEYTSVATKIEPKKSLTVKSGKICPSRICVTTLETGVVEVEYTSTHLHPIKTGTVGLTAPQKSLVVADVKKGIPYLRILQNTQAENKKNPTAPISYLRAADIRNIAQQAGIKKEGILHQNDAQSIQELYDNLKTAGDHSIFLYKPCGEKSTKFPNLQQEEFVMAFMNTGQEFMLTSEGQNVICIDGMHGTNQYGIELTTILTIDDQHEGFPCCFLFHSCKSEETYTAFFQALKERIGELHNRVFMSDDEIAFYTAWTKTFEAPRQKLLCAWHVQKAWSKHLLCLRKADRDKVTSEIQALMRETEKQDFELAYPNFLKNIKQNPATEKVHHYFETYWTRRKEWAYCYRLRAGVNTNMMLERMHGNIKERFLNKKKTKRLDVGFNGVMKYLADKQFSRMSAIERGQISSKDKFLRQAHKKTVEKIIQNPDYLDAIVPLRNGRWVVPSWTNAMTSYYVTKLRLEKPCQCVTRCRHCQFCLHEYECTCVESSVKFNMCKHIHQVRMKFHTDNNVGITEPVSEDEDDDLVIETDSFAEHRQAEAASHIVDLHRQHTNQVSMTTGESVRSKLEEALDLCRSADENQVLIDHINQAVDEILSRRNAVAYLPPVSEAARKQPPNAKIEPQRRFFTKKKKHARKKRVDHHDVMLTLLPIRFQTVPDDIPVGEDMTQLGVDGLVQENAEYEDIPIEIAPESEFGHEVKYVVAHNQRIVEEDDTWLHKEVSQDNGVLQEPAVLEDVVVEQEHVFGQDQTDGVLQFDNQNVIAGSQLRPSGHAYDSANPVCSDYQGFDIGGTDLNNMEEQMKDLIIIL